MAEQPPFEQVLAGLMADSPSAAEAVVRANYARIVGLVRKRIGGRFRSKVDEESVANSALLALFQAIQGSRVTVTDWQDMWNLLARIALRKLANRVRRYSGGTRDLSREVAGDDLPLADAAAGPEAEVIVNDLLDHLTAGYDTAERRVIDLSLLCHSVSDIAADVSLSERTVIRIRSRFQQRLEAAQVADRD